MSKKQTPIDLAFDYFDTILDYISPHEAKAFNDKKAELKELEKQQMKKFFIVGFNTGCNDDTSPSFLTAENYYQKTYEQ